MLEENNNLNINDTETQSTQQEIPNETYNPYQYISEEYKKKRELRRLGIVVGIPVIFISVIGYLWSIAYLFLTTNVAGMTMEEAIILSENPAVQQILQILLSCIMFLLPFTIAAKCIGLRIDQTIKFG